MIWYPPLWQPGYSVVAEAPFLGQEEILDRVDLNTAGVQELTLLPGIGEKRAQDIVAWRETNGPFAGPEDLREVPGIGPKVIEEIDGYTYYS